MDRIRLIASDMDATLLDGHSQLPPDFLHLVQELAGQDILFAAASGRPLYKLEEIPYSCGALQRQFLAVLRGIGIGIPGYSDANRGIAISYSHLKDWKNIPVKDILEKEFHVTCYMDNNVNVMIFAYKWLVYGGKCEDMLFVSIRTGARVIPIINNQPVRGTCGYSGELGHVKVSGGSRICSCGRYGCLNSEISDVAIVNKIIDGIKVGRFREIAEAVQGDMDKGVRRKCRNGQA